MIIGSAIITGRRGDLFVAWIYHFRSQHLGEGIERAIRDAASLQTQDPHVDFVDVVCRDYDVDDESTFEFDEAVVVEPNALWRVREPDTYDGSDDDFVFPVGATPNFDQDDGQLGDAEEIQEGYCVQHLDVNEPYIEVVSDGRRVAEVFFTLVRSLPVADGLEIRVEWHWNDENVTEVFLADPDLVGDGIIDYLRQHFDDIVRNGFLNIGVYCRAEETTLRLTDHKTIEFYAFSYDRTRACEDILRDLNFSAVDPLPSLSHRHGHYHWRPSSSKSRSEFISMITRDGFARVDSYEV